MRKKAAPVISVMLEEIEGIEQALEHVSYDDFCREWQLKRAVQRGIEILSEASKRLPDDIKAEHPAIEWRKVHGIGNILRHEYHRISDEVIWDSVREDFPALKEALLEMAKKYGN